MQEAEKWGSIIPSLTTSESHSQSDFTYSPLPFFHVLV